MDALIPINILIGDRSYRIKVASADEEAVRKTVKQINDKIIEFKTGFAGKDMQDYVAMVLVWYASQVNQQTSASQQIELNELQQELKKLEDRLKEAL
ncbi:MAG: cell division protein ZapA [Bacteroidota bacterium]|jgi:cell division protein ZapA (FtsZ GTPase activity inhibitor)